MADESLTHDIIAAAIEVHRHLGPGLLESAYHACLLEELNERGFEVASELALPVVYKNKTLDCGYKMDLVVNKKVLVELKSIADIAPIHHAQVMSYLKLSGLKIGLLINFNVNRLVDGIKRFAM